MNVLCQYFPMFHMKTDSLMFVSKLMQTVSLFSENCTNDLLVWTCKAKELNLFDNIAKGQNTKTYF